MKGIQDARFAEINRAEQSVPGVRRGKTQITERWRPLMYGTIVKRICGFTLFIGMRVPAVTVYHTDCSLAGSLKGR